MAENRWFATHNPGSAAAWGQGKSRQLAHPEVVIDGNRDGSDGWSFSV